jgi:hypothetical protein
MSADFRLGQKFSAQTEQVKPDSAQKLLALLSDSAGGDEELSSAFRLLFANPVYVSLFLARERPSAAEFSSLTAISSRCLSSLLSARVDSFVAGYFDTLPARELPSDLGTPRSDRIEPDRSVASFPASQGPSASSDSEEVTLFVEDSGADAEQSAEATPQDGEKLKSPGGVSIPVKPISLACVAIAIVIASFRVPAICEPFGLCEKTSESSKDKKNEADLELEPNNNTANPGPEVQPPPLAAPVAEPSPPMALDSPPQRPEVPVRSRPPVVSPPRDAAPMRDQPLW